MKVYKLRMEYEIKATSDAEARRITGIIIKERARMDDVSNNKNSLYSVSDHKVLDEEIR